jgi:CRP/FNR family transcriptional regulator
MSMACCIGDTKSEIRAVAETKGALVMIPISKMEEWLGNIKLGVILFLIVITID